MPRTEALVVVDMQGFFQASHDQSLVAAVTKQIHRAKRRNWPIIFVEYRDCGPTLLSLMEEVAKYENKHIVKKAEDSARWAIQDLMRAEGLRINAFRVCGIYLTACVKKTAIDLARVFTDATVKVLIEATNWASENSLAHFSRTDLPNLVTIPRKFSGQWLKKLAG